MRWTAEDERSFRDYAANPAAHDLEQLIDLVEMLFSNQFGAGTARLAGIESYAATLGLDGFFSTREDAADAADHWQTVIDDIQQILDRRSGR